jgi:hypothetical protein
VTSAATSGAYDEQCTAEPMDSSPSAEIVTCQKHAASVLRLINDRLKGKTS